MGKLAICIKFSNKLFEKKIVDRTLPVLSENKTIPFLFV